MENTQLDVQVADFSALRQDFPVLKQKNRGMPLVYLDNAASAQKPNAVVAAITHFYQHDYANIHRGIYELSTHATDMYDAVREQVRAFINAASTNEIVFVSGTTEAINLLAHSLSLGQGWKAGDEVILSEMEHHANIVPWSLLRDRIGIQLKVIPVTDTGELDMQAYTQLFSPRTKLVSVCHVSNAIGTINPVKEITAIAHRHQVPVLLDGAQAVAHLPVNVQEIDCDFYTFSSHKLYGPTGIGVLYGKQSLLDSLPPYQGGGDMIETVSFSKVTYAKSPAKFEAGTPHIAGVIGLGAAIHYVQAIGMNTIVRHEQQLMKDAQAKLNKIDGLRMIGTAAHKIGIMSFVMDNAHPHDIGTVLDSQGIAIRAGHHCAMPLIERFKVPATVRVSLGLYNNEQDIDQLIDALHKVKEIFS